MNSLFNLITFCLISAAAGAFAEGHEAKDGGSSSNERKASTAIVLNGNQFCRTLIVDERFGQPAGERQHCISFKDGKMTDNADTFFGNPPETLPYKVSGKEILVHRADKWEFAYRIDGATIVNGAGARLEKKK